MSLLFHFAHVQYMLVALFILCCLSVYRFFFYKPTLYRYSLTSYIVSKKGQASLLCTQFFFWMRVAILFLLALLIGKPQFVDSKSKISVDGIDIVLALDVSGSMVLFDDLQDRRSRLDVAKEEALRFVDKRKNDGIALVIFGLYALSLCPLTMDKNILKSVISEVVIRKPSDDDISQGTMLSQGLITACCRLQKSKASSKVIVLMTDGAPSPGDIAPDNALKIAQELGIKVYTIGIGSQQGGFVLDSSSGRLLSFQTPLNTALLQKIAQQTGGKFFEASNPKELSKIYDTIDTLEKSTIQTDLYHKYYDYFMPFAWLAVLLLMIELCMATWVWFIL
ncbi:VWA domain-containing protein [Candidatus Babeliales bacterium]|nr:VWA domain-containing protein [Candidatus Babeliales bacterium]